MSLRINGVGQIKSADVSFGDLTVLVGPQATGKSITLQLLKLVVDAGFVQAELMRYGLDWSRVLPEFLDIYLGEGMRSIWRAGESAIWWDGKPVDMIDLARRKRRDQKESLFFVPAQRVLALRDGWPRPFSDYSPGDPFTVREFSDSLRRLLEQEFTRDSLFPQKNRLKESFRALLQRDVFGNFELKVDKSRLQKRLVLGTPGSDRPLPHMVWSAGQREFVPLLLGFYWLMPPSKISTREDIKWVVIEELEMGLHPKAISVVLLLVLELLSRGYRVCLSTHSPQVLEMVWALRHLKETRGHADGLLRIFGAPSNTSLRKIADHALQMSTRVYYFEGGTGIVHDISALDPDSQAAFESSWGGLSEFSGRANAEVATAVANSPDILGS
jgi:hypothetical protein